MKRYVKKNDRFLFQNNRIVWMKVIRLIDRVKRQGFLLESSKRKI